MPQPRAQVAQRKVVEHITHHCHRLQTAQIAHDGALVVAFRDARVALRFPVFNGVHLSLLQSLVGASVNRHVRVPAEETCGIRRTLRLLLEHLGVSNHGCALAGRQQRRHCGGGRWVVEGQRCLGVARYRLGCTWRDLKRRSRREHGEAVLAQFDESLGQVGKHHGCLGYRAQGLRVQVRRLDELRVAQRLVALVLKLKHRGQRRAALHGEVRWVVHAHAAPAFAVHRQVRVPDRDGGALRQLTHTGVGQRSPQVHSGHAASGELAVEEKMVGRVAEARSYRGRKQSAAAGEQQLLRRVARLVRRGRLGRAWRVAV
jgi:hypothetical protein